MFPSSRLRFPRRRAGAALSFALASAAWSQTAPVLITGNPLGRDQAQQPANVLSGDGLSVRRAGTLGETLDGLPGVSSTWFGPNSSRPVIRGLDGDRIRVLDNSGPSVDASSLSFDHAVALDPLVVERVEVLRGPAALLYGGNATGGVVNTLSNRIPRGPLQELSGRAELRLGGASSERAGSALIEGGAGALAWHADAFARRTGDLRVPSHAPVAGGEVLPNTTRVRNSASDTEGGAIGVAWTDDDGFAGLSVDTTRNRYGVTVEPDVFIRMQRDRVAFAAERRRLPGPISAFEIQASHTRYRHEEVEGSGEVGTTFRSQGNDLRIQARHAALGPWTGVFGVQSEALDFSALGEEAFVPGTRTRSNAAFLLEELKAAGMTWSVGARVERVKVASEGDVADAEVARFGAPGERTFRPTSLSLGLSWPMAAGWSASAGLGRTERAPTFYELFANGLHLATAAYERGDANLREERSLHTGLGLQWSRAGSSFGASLFDTRFARFISLTATGAEIEVPGEGVAEGSLVPEYGFRTVKAHLRGFELEGRHRLVDRPWTLDLTGSLDRVRADDLSRGEPLPRIAPMRLRLGIEAAQGAWRVGVSLNHAAAQDRVPGTDAATPSSTLLNTWLSWTRGDALWFARLDNIGNRLAYSATTIATLRGLVPLPGRALAAGLRLRF
jgi:iron complex outermembrane receptor protein